MKDEKDYFPAEERKRETINEMIERWIKAEEKRHEKETRGIEKENDSSTDSKIEKDGTIDVDSRGEVNHICLHGASMFSRLKR